MLLLTYLLIRVRQRFSCSSEKQTKHHENKQLTSRKTCATAIRITIQPIFKYIYQGRMLEIIHAVVK